jgi:thiamine biosynthesis protein ThiI
MLQEKVKTGAGNEQMGSSSLKRPGAMIIHYSEIALKKGNRGYYEKALKRNIEVALSDLDAGEVKNDFGRLILSLSAEAPVERIIERLKKVIGIAHFRLAYSGSTDMEILKEQIYQGLAGLSFSTFRVTTRRADKQFPYNSQQICQLVGQRIHQGLSKPVDLENPELTVSVEIFNNQVFYSFERIEGTRGLPVGSSGKVVGLLSSGIDSPVAAYRMMTRGCKVIFCHFHSFPFTEKSSYYNALSLAKRLTEYQYGSKIYLVPLAKLQEAIILKAPPRLRVILYRRMMFRLAEVIARKEKAKALITGESLGQVASQTLENISAISQVISLPILRPLIGMDKEEIVSQARTLGTYETSTEPYDDCCSYLVPQHPETKARLSDVLLAESQITDLEALLRESIDQTEVKVMKFPGE